MNLKFVKIAFALVMAWQASGQTTNVVAPANVIVECTNGFYFDSERNRMVYQGNVRVWDRDMELMCEVLTIYFYTNQGTRLNTIVAETNVLIVQKDSWAFGDVAVYSASNDVMTLSATSGEVLLDSPDFSLIGAKVIYDRKSQKMSAPGAIRMITSTEGSAFGTNSSGFAFPGVRGTNAPRSRSPSPSRRTGP